MTVGKHQSWVIAGDLTKTGSEPGGTIGHQYRMNGGDILFYFTPETARQWIQALEPITEEETK